jgi:hypothetical protein
MSAAAAQDQPAAWPSARIVIGPDCQTLVTVAGVTWRRGQADTLEAARATTLAAVAELSRHFARPIRTSTLTADADDRGAPASWPLVVRPDGSVHADPDAKDPATPTDDEAAVLRGDTAAAEGRIIALRRPPTPRDEPDTAPTRPQKAWPGPEPAPAPAGGQSRIAALLLVRQSLHSPSAAPALGGQPLAGVACPHSPGGFDATRDRVEVLGLSRHTTAPVVRLRYRATLHPAESPCLIEDHLVVPADAFEAAAAEAAALTRPASP